MVLHDCELQDRVTNLSCRLLFVFTDYVFNLQAVLLVAAVIDSVRVQKEQVSRAHEGDFGHVRGVDLPRPERHRKIFVPVGMIFGNLQPERQELDHAGVIDLHKPVVLGGKHQRGRMPEIYEAKMPARTYFTVQHGRDFARIVVRIAS